MAAQNAELSSHRTRTNLRPAAVPVAPVDLPVAAQEPVDAPEIARVA